MRRWYSYGRYTTTHYLLTDNLGRFVYNTLLHLVLQWTLYLISPQPFYERLFLSSYVLSILPTHLPHVVIPQIPQLRTRSYPLSPVFFVCFFTYPVTSRFVLVTNMILTVLLRFFFWFRPALLPPLHCIVLHIIPPHGPAFVTSPFPLLPLILIPSASILILCLCFVYGDVSRTFVEPLYIPLLTVCRCCLLTLFWRCSWLWNKKNLNTHCFWKKISHMESVVYLSVPLSLFVRGANMIILTGRRHRDCTYAGHININVRGGDSIRFRRRKCQGENPWGIMPPEGGECNTNSDLCVRFHWEGDSSTSHYTIP